MTISVANLNVSYGRWQALHDVSCQAQAGKITVVVGPNASGKSTLLRTIAGVQRPSHGRITIQRRGSARSIKRLSPRKRAVALAYVAQRPTISARFSVRQVVSLGRYALGRSEDRVDWAMEMVGLQQSLFHRPFAELSVGQQQLVAVARALAQLGPDPQKTLDMSGRYLVLDEPTAALDLKHVGAVTAVARLLADAGATVLMALHDLTLAAQAGDEAWLLSQGRLIAAGNVDQVLEPRQLSEVFGCGFRLVREVGGGSYLLPA